MRSNSTGAIEGIFLEKNSALGMAIRIDDVIRVLINRAEGIEATVPASDWRSRFAATVLRDHARNLTHIRDTLNGTIPPYRREDHLPSRQTKS